MIHRWYIQKFIPDLQPREHDKTAKAYLRAQKNASPAKSREAFDRFRLKIHKFCISIRARSVVSCTAGQGWPFSGTEPQTAFGRCTYTRRGMGRRSQSRPLSRSFFCAASAWGRVSPESRLRSSSQSIRTTSRSEQPRTSPKAALWFSWSSLALTAASAFRSNRTINRDRRITRVRAPFPFRSQRTQWRSIVSRSVPSSSVCTRSG